MSKDSKREQLRALYRRVPNIDCKRRCQQACGPILTSRLERSIIVKSAGVGPGVGPELTCRLLRDGLCSVYRDRPMICRLYGTTQALRCEHGCVPDRWLSDEEATMLLEESLRIGGDDPHQARTLLAQLDQAFR